MYFNTYMKWGRLHDENRQGYRYFVTNEFQCFFEGSHAHVTVSQYTFYIAYIIALFCSMQLGAFCIFQRFFQEICAVFWHLKKSSVLSREKGRYYLPFDTKGGENMEPNRTEFQKQCIFQSFCKRVLHNEACNAHMMKSGGAEKSLCLFLISPCMKNSSFTLLTNIFKTKKQSRAITSKKQSRKKM